MVGECGPEVLPGCPQGVMEHVIRIIHLIDPEHGLEAAFIETCIVCDNRQTFYPGPDLFPHLREYRGVFGILRAQTVHLLAEPLVIFRFRMDQGIKFIHNFPVTHNHNAHRTHARRAFIGRFKVQSTKISHATKLAIIRISPYLLAVCTENRPQSIYQDKKMPLF